MKQTKILPGQRENESLDDFILRSWNSELGLQEEFSGDFETYEAYCRADSINSIKILGKSSEKS